MNKPALVVMAAGMGSRYGGLKQIDPVGPNGEIIMDYSIYDALMAGFGKIVFVIKKENEDLFREKVGKRIEKIVDTEYAFQSVDDVPKWFKVPEGRVKPWGTAHAVMSCKNVIDTPFAVINADDFYGSETFQSLYNQLVQSKDTDKIYNYCMVGFILENTLTEYGHVARGVCTIDDQGYLMKIIERTKIKKFGYSSKYTEDDINWVEIPKESIVSMNTWGFNPSIFAELEERFGQFLKSSKENILSAEYFLPSVVDRLINEGKARVKVIPSNERWYGVTYREDKPVVKKAIENLIKRGVYPNKLL